MGSRTGKSILILLAMKDDQANSEEQAKLNDYIERMIEFHNSKYNDYDGLYLDFISLYNDLYKLRDSVTFGSVKGKQPLPKDMINKIEDLLDKLSKINDEKISEIG